MDNVATAEKEKQQRGQAFLQARERLEREYNCTVTIAPKWEPGVSGTFVLAFDEQVMVGPVPMKPEMKAITLEEFEQRYAERSGVTVEWLHAHDQYGTPCDCGMPGCKGWQMRHIPAPEGEAGKRSG